MDRLDAAQRELVFACGHQAAARGDHAFLVGGSVRDLILGREHDDLDVVVEGDGLAVAQSLARSVAGHLTRHHAFQTATVTTPEGVRVDVATARAEEYPRLGQLPQITPGTLRQDLERRDFTINTMAISLHPDDRGTFIDPLGGLADLRSERIRVMHPRSFADDPTRVLRGLRFALRFGYEIEEQTGSWLREAIAGGYLAEVSGDRVRKEVRLSFSEAPVHGPLRLHQEGVLQEIHPDLAAHETHLRRLEDALDRFDRGPASATAPAVTSRWVLRLTCCAAEMAPQGRWGLVRRLRLSREERAPLIDAGAPWRRSAEQLASSGGMRDSDLERALRPVSQAALLVVAAVHGEESSEARAVWHYLEALQGMRSALSGADLLDLGVPEGPAVGDYLEKLRAARLDGKANTAADERRLVAAWLAGKPL